MRKSRKRKKSVKKQRRKYRKRTPKKTKKILSGGAADAKGQLAADADANAKEITLRGVNGVIKKDMVIKKEGGVRVGAASVLDVTDSAEAGRKEVTLNQVLGEDMEENAELTFTMPEQEDALLAAEREAAYAQQLALDEEAARKEEVKNLRAELARRSSASAATADEKAKKEQEARESEEAEDELKDICESFNEFIALRLSRMVVDVGYSKKETPLRETINDMYNILLKGHDVQKFLEELEYNYKASEYGHHKEGDNKWVDWKAFYEEEGVETDVLKKGEGWDDFKELNKEMFSNKNPKPPKNSIIKYLMRKLMKGTTTLISGKNVILTCAGAAAQKAVAAVDEE
ncbi:MAG: hypothetical protein CL470_03920 [Acidimicrobiaceae bacterium]|nr:hypothetical protein [Acidimicrobiaceae bacterium]